MVFKSIVAELQHLAASDYCSCSELLRKALIAAEKLKLEDMGQWIHRELNGYSKSDKLPEYRILLGQIRYHNPYNGWRAVVFQDEREAELATRAECHQGVGDLEALIAPSGKESHSIMQPLPHEFVYKFAAQNLGMEPIKFLDAAQIKSVLASVRSALLEWSLRLEKEGIMGEG